jgi:hypothetical protein
MTGIRALPCSVGVCGCKNTLVVRPLNVTSPSPLCFAFVSTCRIFSHSKDRRWAGSRCSCSDAAEVAPVCLGDVLRELRGILVGDGVGSDGGRVSTHPRCGWAAEVSEMESVALIASPLSRYPTEPLDV